MSGPPVVPSPPISTTVTMSTVHCSPKAPYGSIWDSLPACRPPTTPIRKAAKVNANSLVRNEIRPIWRAASSSSRTARKLIVRRVRSSSSTSPVAAAATPSDSQYRWAVVGAVLFRKMPMFPPRPL
jgi:hypothetical protein